VRRRAAALIAAVGLAAAGCGASGQSRDYAAAVCSEMAAWVDTVNSSLAELGETVSERTTVRQEVEAVGRHLDDVEAATAELIASLQDVPTAEVEGAEALSTRLVVLLEKTQAVTEEIRRKVQGLEDQGLSEFRQTVGPLLGRRIGGLVRQLIAAPTDPAAGEVAEGFQEEPSCDEVLSPAEQDTGPGT
jgi:uncharacterized protein YggL (DUF469 family)